MLGRWTGSGPVEAAESADLLYRLTPAAIAAAAMMATPVVTIQRRLLGLLGLRCLTGPFFLWPGQGCTVRCASSSS